MTCKNLQVAVNEGGRRIGESHPRAALSDHDCALMLELHDEGWGWRRLSKKFDCSRSQARRICLSLQRAQLTARIKPVPRGTTFDGVLDDMA